MQPIIQAGADEDTQLVAETRRGPHRVLEDLTQTAKSSPEVARCVLPGLRIPHQLHVFVNSRAALVALVPRAHIRAVSSADVSS